MPVGPNPLLPLLLEDLHGDGGRPDPSLPGLDCHLLHTGVLLPLLAGGSDGGPLSKSWFWPAPGGAGDPPTCRAVVGGGDAGGLH